jgi:hypothetical protein
MTKKTDSKYNMTPSAYNQRMANLMKFGMNKDKLLKNLIEKEGLTEDETKLLIEERINLAKRMSMPAVMLMDEYIFLKTMMNVKLMKGRDVLEKDMLNAARILLEISKEINRLTTVSAEKQYDAFTRSLNDSDKDDFVINVDEEGYDVKGRDTGKSEEKV